MNRDLTTGAPGRVLTKFCLPLFGSIIFQQLYNIADSFTAGRFIGENALAAVGNSYEITLLFIAFSFGCNIGCSVITARYFGAKDTSKLKTTVYTTFIAGAAVCAVLMCAGLIFAPQLLTIINTPQDIFQDSLLYLKIYISGFPFVLFYNVATGIFSALGDSKTPFFFLTASSLANIVMDILFVTRLSEYFPRGVDGVAWATLICQGISCILSLVFVARRLSIMKTDTKPRIFSGAILKEITAIAVPSILQQSFISVGNIILQGIINFFGAGVIAGYSAAIKLNNLVITSFTTLGNGISNYTAQNLGAEKRERIHPGFVAGLRLMGVICVPIIILYTVFSRCLISVFLKNPSVTAMDTGVAILRILAPFYFVVASKLVSDGVLRGAAKMKLFMTATFTDLILRVVLAKLFSYFWGTTGIWLAWPVGWAAGTAVSLVFYTVFVKKGCALRPPNKTG